MKCILSSKPEVFFNLAAEEYLLKQKEEEACLLWQSQPAIVVGKHQNALAEIGYRFAREQGITVARRLTGGGTVYHDAGNLNFTLIRKGEPGKMIDFGRHIGVILDFLRSRGIRAEMGEKHEILAGDFKISGNAEHIYKNKVLHHGTLLFNADLSALHAAIRHEGGVYNDRAVQSNRAKVANLSGMVPSGTTMEQFRDDLYRYLLDYFSGNPYDLSQPDEEAIGKLAREKYNTWEWIYGWSPDYAFSNRVEVGGLRAIVRFSTHRGLIREFGLESDNLSPSEKISLNRSFEHVVHRYGDVSDVLRANGLEELVPTKNWDDLVYGFF